MNYTKNIQGSFMSRYFKLFSLTCLVFLAGCQSAAFAAGEAIRWVKIYNTELNSRIKPTVSVTNFEHQFYSCGEGCQMVKLIADEINYRGSLIISLRDTSCPASTTIDVPFTFEYEEIETPFITYDVDLGNSFCHKQHIQAVVTGNPDSIQAYKINLI
jgi:hypothetical protein